MRRLIYILLLLLLSSPCLAWNEKAADDSLQFLNDSVYNKIPTFKQSLYNDYAEIVRIIGLYKQNPNLIKTNQIHEFGLACQRRNQTLLSVYENEYFKPAYKKYAMIDNSIDFEFWKDCVALAEGSLFYDFYTLTEANLQDCTKIVERSTNH